MADRNPTTTLQPIDFGLVTPDTALELAGSLFELVPDVSDDPTPRMMAAILNAPDPKAINHIFESRSIKASAGRTARFNAIRKAPSDFTTGPKFYLIADVAWADNGESDVLTISSLMSIVELLQAQRLGWFPLTATVVQKDRKTSNGFFPIHLRITEYTQPDAAKA